MENRGENPGQLERTATSQPSGHLEELKGENRNVISSSFMTAKSKVTIMVTFFLWDSFNQ